MKHIRYISYAAIALLTTTITSCKKQLDEYNPGNPTAEEVWKTPQGFVTNVNAAYYEQRYWYGKEDGLFMAESGTDIWFNQNKAGYARQFSKYDALDGTIGYLKNTWPKFWASINLCNAGIERIDKAGFTDEVEKKKRLGELHFLRAFYYWHVVETWGNVMLRTQETKGIELTAERSSIPVLYDLMVDDLLKAKDYLPISWSTGTTGEYSRASKKSAMGMLARVYLTRAYYSTGAEANTWFTKARDAAKEVIDNKTALGTDLWTSYADLWKPANNKNNKEALYIISNSATNTASNYDADANRLHGFYMCKYSDKPGLTRSIAYGFDNNMRLMPTLSLLNLFQEDVDMRYEVSFKETFAANTAYLWTASDLTKYGKNSASVPAGTPINVGSTAFVVTKKVVTDKDKLPYVIFDRNDLYNADGTITNDANKNICFPILQKFIDPSRTLIDGQAGYNDIMVIRLAEMYMIAAEAEFKLGNNAAAASYVNELRKRAVKSAAQLPGFLVTATDITVDFLLDERAREFAGEQLRWFDLKRMLTPAAFVARIKTKNPDITLVQEFHRLRPIPQTELDALLNGKDFGQNIGY
jgi:hypothetical protein